MACSRFCLSMVVFYLLTSCLAAQDTLETDSTQGKIVFVDDDPVTAMLDSLATLKIFKDGDSPHSFKYQSIDDIVDTVIPIFPDSVYAERLAQLSDQSPFEYVYNREVRQFIDLYSVKKRILTARILGLAQIYFPLFEEQFDKYNMPLELKYLAVIESALNPTANSRAGAKGLWQFMYGTGKVYGLKVTSYVDERYDPYKSTIAACEHLQDLYDIYGNWPLALAAYNSGAGNVNKAIRRSGGIKNFWAIHHYLPRETRSYVPAFIAASYVLTYASEHKLVPLDPGILYYEVDTVTVRNPLTFTQISELLHTPLEELAFLNPSFKQGVIPASPDFPYQLRLRKKYIGDYINNETLLYAYKSKNGIQKDSLVRLVNNSYRETQQYKVHSGESLSTIANKFGMTVQELKTLNNLTKNYIKVNQRLLVYVRQSKSSGTAIKESGTSGVKINETPLSVHVVTYGESLSLIAQKYRCSVDQLMKWNNLSNSKIFVCQKLKVTGSPVSSGTGTVASVASAKQQSVPSNGKFFYYTIQSGDNLWDIANKFDVTVSQIKALNNFKNASRIKPGEKIKIPK